MAASVAAPSCPLAGFCNRLSCRAWLLPSCRYGFSRFGRSSNRDGQFQLGLFCRAMVAMVQWLNARSFFFHTLLIVSIFLALAFKICRNRFRCHGQSLAELSSSRLCNLALSTFLRKCIGGSEFGLGSPGTHLPIRRVASQNNLRD